MPVTFPLTGEHPAAMQRGCASNVDYPILAYICASFTMMLHGVDVIFIMVPLMSSIVAKALSLRNFNKLYLNLR